MRRPVLVLMVLAGAPSMVRAQQLAYEGGLGGSTGTYFFTERTNSYSLSTGLRLSAGRWSFRASLPAWLQNTTLLTASGAGPVPTGGPEGQQAVRDSGQARQQRGKQGPAGQGAAPLLRTLLAAEAVPAPAEAVTGYRVTMADPLVSTSVRLITGGRVGVSAGANAKVPLADTTVSTGAWDFGGNLSLSLLLGDRWTVGLDASYWRLGDLDSLDLRNPLLGSASVGVLLGSRWAALAAVSGSTTVLEGFDPPAAVSVALSRLTPGFSWGVSLGAGLTESSPDLMVGLTWTVPLAPGR
jgi:hypothetical protein